MKFSIIIPARIGSKRFPKKLLFKIFEKPILFYTIQNAKNSLANKIIVATDSQEIFNYSRKLDCEACLIEKKCDSGTERLYEAIKKFNLQKEEIIINLQGDEILVNHNIINTLAKKFVKNKSEVETLGTHFTNLQDLLSFDSVKIVLDCNQNALYFSRYPIPWRKENDAIKNKTVSNYIKHIGIYIYSSKFIQIYHNWKKTKLEKMENLEQLRILWYARKIHVTVLKNIDLYSVNRIKDIKIVEKILKNELYGI
ncbi:3-deoxy-manno-octulosonate cytidylyltransferase [bacterium endosymbiont of Pedicinus badii]|uniref:3-deoxy-manno-octulosonate cytidylyltransferase n=1 Tax=bacterium endosymbiont of Pedicinus badii TaxID=1719126 RepID=UPI0009B98B21|nr:3-deoxy-manno-octulosonate cytidylyltransferase [bacterium endosymbiont of Pedicinus badii]OQM34350.1 hypothetical protein AOQ89_00425 [bacterium endosymbiont of Pedicinus badii]